MIWFQFRDFVLRYGLGLETWSRFRDLILWSWHSAADFDDVVHPILVFMRPSVQAVQQAPAVRS